MASSNRAQLSPMVDNAKAVWVRFGREIRRRRKNAGLMQAQLAKAIAVSPSMVSSMERGTRSPKKDHVEALDNTLNTSGALLRMWVDCSNKEDFPPWFQKAIDLERAASEIREYHLALVPGPLQTAGYAEAIFRQGRLWDTEDSVERLVDARMKRKEIFDKADRPIMWVVLDESVIRRVVGGVDIAREQLGHLLSQAEEGMIRLQVIPWNADPHPGLSGPFRVFSFSDRPSVAAAERMEGEELLDDHGQVRRFLARFTALQTEAMPPRATVDLIEKVRGELDE